MTFTRICRTARLAVAIALAAGLSQGEAHADGLYNYSFMGSGVSGSGTVGIIATTKDGTFKVTSITGQVNGINIKGLLPEGTYKNNDNLFFQSEDGYVDDEGVSFDLDDSDDSQLNIYSSGTDEDGNPNYFFQGDQTFQLTGGGSPPSTSTFSPFKTANDSSGPNVALSEFSFSPAAEMATTPEPSGLMLLGTGVLATAGMARRRFMKQ